MLHLHVLSLRQAEDFEVRVQLRCGARVVDLYNYYAAEFLVYSNGQELAVSIERSRGCAVLRFTQVNTFDIVFISYLIDPDLIAALQYNGLWHSLTSYSGISADPVRRILFED